MPEDKEKQPVEITIRFAHENPKMVINPYTEEVQEAILCILNATLLDAVEHYDEERKRGYAYNTYQQGSVTVEMGEEVERNWLR